IRRLVEQEVMAARRVLRMEPGDRQPVERHGSELAPLHLLPCVERERHPILNAVARRRDRNQAVLRHAVVPTSPHQCHCKTNPSPMPRHFRSPILVFPVEKGVRLYEGRAPLSTGGREQGAGPTRGRSKWLNYCGNDRLSGPFGTIHLWL